MGTAITKYEMGKGFKLVPYLTEEEIGQLLKPPQNKKDERDNLLILTLFTTGLRVSEVLTLTPTNLFRFEGGYAIKVLGKGKKERLVACPIELANEILAFSYRYNIKPNERIFQINRQRVWQIVKARGSEALNKKVWPHLFRHSCAIYRLRATGNPRALQHHLGHSSITMTMRYLSTLTVEDSLRIQQGVNFNISNLTKNGG